MPKETHEVLIELTMHRFSTAPGDIDEGCCLACDKYLDLHQPDVGSPDRLVGICEQCGRWYLIDVTPETDEAVMVLLPEGDSVQDALAASESVVEAETPGGPAHRRPGVPSA